MEGWKGLPWKQVSIMKGLMTDMSRRHNKAEDRTGHNTGQQAGCAQASQGCQ